MSLDSPVTIANRHDFETSFTSEYDTNKTALTIITPTTGKIVGVKGIYINTEGNSGYIRVYFGTSGNSIFTIYAGATPASGYVPLVIDGSVNETIKVTSTVGNGNNYYLLVNYKEV